MLIACILNAAAMNGCTLTNERITQALANDSAQSLLHLWSFDVTDTDKGSPLYLPVRKPAPKCRSFSKEQCPQTDDTCDCNSVTRFYRKYTQPSRSATSDVDLSNLRIFFLEGHTGPMNDMAAFLNQVIGVPTNNFDHMVFLQALILRNQINPKYTESRGKLLGGNFSLQINQFLTETRSGHWFTMPNCERRGCRRAAYDDTLRRSFADKFGKMFESRIDVVACNFPTWQCMLFMYINVTVAMRYTHRYDHHLQGVRLPKTFKKKQLLSYAASKQLPESAAQEAAYALKRMAKRPNVFLTASNPYDWLYLRWTIGVNASPWAGLSVQLSSIPYTGTRPQVLFCCGSSPYNKAIKRMADVIVNTSRAQAISSNSPVLEFAWLSELYPKGWECHKGKHPKELNTTDQNETSSTTGRRLRARDTEQEHSSTGRKSRLRRAKPTSTKPATIQCGYRYSDVAAHPFAVLLPYSVHSYGFVQAYSMGLPILVPSLRLLATLHHRTGFMGHKGPGNVPWRATPHLPQRTFLTNDGGLWYSPESPAKGAPCCEYEPNDGCSVNAAARWLQFADFYQWPGLLYYDTPAHLITLARSLASNETWRHTISKSQKRFFRRRALGSVRCSPGTRVVASVLQGHFEERTISTLRYMFREQARTEKHVRNGLSRALIAARRMRAASRDATAPHF